MIRAGRSLEHPGRNLQPAIRVRPAQRAAENDTVGLLDRFMNGHLKLKPRVPRIQKLLKHGPVGVLKPCCTTPHARIRLTMGLPRPQCFFETRVIGFATPTSSADRPLPSKRPFGYDRRRTLTMNEGREGSWSSASARNECLVTLARSPKAVRLLPAIELNRSRGRFPGESLRAGALEAGITERLVLFQDHGVRNLM